MAGRIRTIKPEVLEDEVVSSLSDGAWRLWVSLWTLADDHGNCRCSPKWFCGQIWWAKGRDHIEVEQLIAELADTKRIDIYQVRGDRYLHVNNWEKHQRIDNAGKPRVPTPQEGTPASAVFRGESPRVSASLREPPLDHDHRPPTTDPEGDHRPPDSGESGSDVQPSLALEVQAPAPKFDFEGIYRAHWVRKEGKQDGMEICERDIKTEADFQQWVIAVKNYGRLMIAEKRAVDKQKHFDSFMRRWRDYVDVVAPGSVMDSESAEKGRSLF